LFDPDSFLEHLLPRFNQNQRFTALKPASEIKNVLIEMGGYKFDAEKINFYANDDAGFPDEINITVTHDDLTEENKRTITNGVFIFLDNFIGELAFVTTIDDISVSAKNASTAELIPIEKLKDFLIWRQKEFVERYEGTRHDTEHDSFSILEAGLDNGNAIVAVINTELLEWDSTASHPWIVAIEMKYDGVNNSGMPDKDTQQLLESIENELLEELKDFDGYLNIGRQTGDNQRKIYFACRDFRKPSIVLHQKALDYANRIKLDYDIYKDKYWRSLTSFRKDLP
jgi:hypothetical protein